MEPAIDNPVGKPEKNLPGIFFERAAVSPDRAALLYKQEEKYLPITWREMAVAVREVSLGLIRLGVKSGDRVGILSYNRPEWAIADLAILAAGGITVPVYHTSTPRQVADILGKSLARFIFLGRPGQAWLLAESEPCPTAIFFDSLDRNSMRGEGFDLNGLRELGRSFPDGEQRLIERIDSISPSDTATIIYTSGTTGDPKGVMLTHGNVLADVEAGMLAVATNPGDVCLSFLPLSHILERTVGQFLMLMAGATIAYAESVRSVADNLPEVSPTVVIGVPRFFEKLYQRVQDGMKKSPAPARIIFGLALAVGRRYQAMEMSGKKPSLILSLGNRLADRVVFDKLKKKLGGRIRFFISGGAPLDPEIVEFFLSAGVKILEGYGLTETSPVVSVNRLERVKPGTVGQPLPGVDVSIAGDGEILVKGKIVMAGYYGDPVATAAAIHDGWLGTGDLGELDEDGFLRITGRKKDILITAGGKNVSPEAVERRISSDELIQQAVLYGDRKKYLTALIVPDYDRLRLFLPGLVSVSFEDIARREDVNRLLMERVTARTADLAPFERPQKIVVLPAPFTEERGEMTASLKVRRNRVIERHKAELEALYEGE